MTPHIVHPKTVPFSRRIICLTRIIQWITRLRRIIRYSAVTTEPNNVTIIWKRNISLLYFSLTVFEMLLCFIDLKGSVASHSFFTCQLTCAA